MQVGVVRIDLNPIPEEFYVPGRLAGAYCLRPPVAEVIDDEWRVDHAPTGVEH
jgi:hypothetical protein